MHADGIGDEYPIGPIDEEATFDNTDDTPNALLQSRGVDDGIEVAIKDAIAAVGDKGVASGRVPQAVRWRPAPRAPPRLAPTRIPRPRRGPARACPDRSTSFYTVNDDREVPAGGGNDLLPQQGAAQTFDQIERAALHFIRTVDREIDRRCTAKEVSGMPSAAASRCRSFRGRNANKAKALAMASGKRLDGEGGRRAGAKSDDHAVLNQRDRRFRRLALERVPARPRWKGARRS